MEDGIKTLQRFGVLEECDQRNSKGRWPEPRSGHRMCADDNFLYVFGGYDAAKDNCLYQELWRFNITTEKWSKLPDDENGAPKECLSSTMLLWRRKIIVYGGTGYPFGEEKGNQIYMYCLKTFKWFNLSEVTPNKSSDEISSCVRSECCCVDRIAPSPSPLARYGHSMALSEANGDIYIHSGTEGTNTLDELFKFNLMERTWNIFQFCFNHEEKVPSPRFRHEAVSHGDDFYIFGGSSLSHHDQFDNKNVHSFSHQHFKWTEHPCGTTHTTTDDVGELVPEYPEPRRAHSCVVHSDTMYMIAGRNDSDHFLDDIWKFDLKEKLWTKLPGSFPYQISFHASAVTSQGCMYVFGGTDSHVRRTNKLHKMWLCAPNLKEQAWMKIVSELKRCQGLTKDALRELGVPSNFYHRLDDTCKRNP